MDEKVLILGKGYLGTRLQEQFRCALSQRRVTSLADAERIIRYFRPDVLINCIGYHGTKNIDDCDRSPDRTIQANTIVPLLLGEAAIKSGIRLVHISSGCLFHYQSGQSHIKEEASPDFFETLYARTKIYADLALTNLSKKYPILTLRIRLPLDDRPHPFNLLNKLLQFQSVIDQPSSITYIPDFLNAMEHLIRIKATGVYNIINPGSISFINILKIYQKFVPGHRYRIITPEQLKNKRAIVLLSARKLIQSGFPIRPIQQVIEPCVQNYVQHIHHHKKGASRAQKD